ncbi:hypothetical protein DERP_006849 [Dermatophagoides pteronyssinus]|uniref:Uncharacterized protein n=1 Tax=Dermatophagoides pteronyssinus TaxID=6956 RepID=A0ABQ8IS66_DERPT|nr:hypothetical protein DERP_006849 [Dermatophagoides pteronyssinus]
MMPIIHNLQVFESHNDFYLNFCVSFVQADIVLLISCMQMHPKILISNRQLIHQYVNDDEVLETETTYN